MSKYIIKAEKSPMGASNPEFAPSQDLVNGIEADGFLLMIKKDGRPSAVVIHELTIIELAMMLAADKTEAGSVIRQAIAIAEGLKKANEIKKENDKYMMAKGLADILRAK
jgi:hypothetical protein